MSALDLETETTRDPALKHWPFTTGLPCELGIVSRIKGLKYEIRCLRAALEDEQTRSAGRLVLIEEQARELAELRDQLRQRDEKLSQYSGQLSLVARVARDYADRRDDEAKQLQRKCDGYQASMHRIWNDRIAGGPHAANP